MQILIVEDNTVNQFVAGKLLNKWGAEFDIASNGKEALDYLAVQNYDVVLMDVQMPVMDGLEATNQIRKGRSGIKNPNVPIIGLSADAFEETKTIMLEAGMNDYLSKPIMQDQLYNKIKSFCPQNKSQ